MTAAPVLLHAKTAVIVDVWSRVGSPNIDHWILGEQSGDRRHRGPRVRFRGEDGACQGSRSVRRDSMRLVEEETLRA